VLVTHLQATKHLETTYARCHCPQNAATVAVMSVSARQAAGNKPCKRKTIGEPRHDMWAAIWLGAYCFSLQQRPCQLDYEVFCPHMHPWRNNMDDASHVGLHSLTTSATQIARLEAQKQATSSRPFSASQADAATTRLIPHLQDADSSTAGICRHNAHAVVPYHWRLEQHLRNVVSR
jgi:hypothetical protein